MVTRYLAGGSIPSPGVIGPFPLLDTLSVPAAMAYSSRRLKASYTGKALKVRRSSDNALLDIGFSSAAHLDTAAMSAFVGAGSGFIDTWYDQSGNSTNATTPSNAVQPRLVDTGVTHVVNGKAVMDMVYVGDNPGDERFLITPTAPISQPQPITIVIVTALFNVNLNHFTDGASSRLLIGQDPNTSVNYQLYAGALPIGSGGLLEDQHSHSLIGVFSSPNSALYVDGVAVITGLVGTDPFSWQYIGASTNQFPIDGVIAEYIVFFSALSAADRAKIVASQQLYWRTG